MGKKKSDDQCHKGCSFFQDMSIRGKNNLTTCSNMITKDINHIYSNTDRNLDEISFVNIKIDINTALDYDKRCFDDIESILFVDMNGNMVSVG